MPTDPTEPYVFPGTTPFIVEAAEELGFNVPPHLVQKIQAIRTISVLVAQIADHPDPSILVEHAAQHLQTLAVADLAARKMIDVVHGVIAPPPEPKSADKEQSPSSSSKGKK